MAMACPIPGLGETRGELRLDAPDRRRHITLAVAPEDCRNVQEIALAREHVAIGARDWVVGRINTHTRQ